MKAPLVERHPTPAPDESPSGVHLPTGIKESMEARFGHDFSQVRLHADPNASAKADALSARAFTEGEHVYFAQSQFQPDTTRGQHLLAHELTHVIQQRGRSGTSIRAGSGATAPTRVRNPGAEREANATASQVVAGRGMAGRRLPVTHTHAGVQCQDRDGPVSDTAPAKPKESPDPLTGGLKVVADELEKNEKVKAKIIEPLKARAKSQFDLLDPADKAVLIGWGAATYGLALGSVLSDPKGRAMLADVNLAAPLILVPYLITDFRLPSEKPDQRHLVRLKLGFDAPVRLTFFRGGPPVLMNAHLAFDVTGAWDVDAQSPLVAGANLKLKVGQVEIKGGYDLGLDPKVRANLNASVGIGKAVTVSGGRYSDLLTPQPIGHPDPDGNTILSKKSIPDYFKGPPIPDTRVMINVDIVELVDLVRGGKSDARKPPPSTIGVDERR